MRSCISSIFKIETRGVLLVENDIWGKSWQSLEHNFPRVLLNAVGPFAQPSIFLKRALKGSSCVCVYLCDTINGGIQISFIRVGFSVCVRVFINMGCLSLNICRRSTWGQSEQQGQIVLYRSTKGQWKKEGTLQLEVGETNVGGETQRGQSDCQRSDSNSVFRAPQQTIEWGTRPFLR